MLRRPIQKVQIFARRLAGAHTFRSRRTGKNAVYRYAGSGYRLCNPARHGNLRRLGHSVMHHFHWDLHSRLARNEEDTPLILFQCRDSLTSLMTLTSKKRYQSASGISQNGFGSNIPTLFTSTSTAGSFAMIFCAPDGSEKSTSMAATITRLARRAGSCAGRASI
jgi:hypothetical protein